MTTLDMQAGGRLRATQLYARNVLLYVVRGRIAVGNHDDLVSAYHLVELGSEGEEIEIRADTDALLLFGHAEPIHEPVVAHGPFVMTTREEIAQAIDDYQAGRFGSALG